MYISVNATHDTIKRTERIVFIFHGPSCQVNCTIIQYLNYALNNDWLVSWGDLRSHLAVKEATIHMLAVHITYKKKYLKKIFQKSGVQIIVNEMRMGIMDGMMLSKYNTNC